MSRAAASKASKEEGKANREAKVERKEYEKQCGTGDIKKNIGADELLCTSCGATKLGPTVCECKGGKVRPGPGNDGLAELVVAAKARMAKNTATRIAESNRNADAVAKDRANRKQAREDDQNDLTKEFQGDGVEILQVVEFAVGKLGMEIEKNAVSKITDGQAKELKVHAGWIIHLVDNEPVEADKKAIAKAMMKAMKKGPVNIAFRVPIQDGFLHCAACNKFLDANQYEEGQLEKVPGIRICSNCEEFADLGDFGD